MKDDAKLVEMQSQAAEIRTDNFTFGIVIDSRSYVVNIDPDNHVLIYTGRDGVEDAAGQPVMDLVGNGEWNGVAIADAQGIFEEEDWPKFDEAILQSGFPQR